MGKKVSEEFIVNVLYNQLKGGEGTLLKEVPHVGQSVDLVSFSERDIVVYEAKISNWRRAIQQCRAHELVADFIWIAIAQKKCSDSLIKQADELGYGVMIYKEDCNAFFVVVDPKRNINHWKPQKDVLMQYLNQFSNESTTLDELRHVC